MNDEIFKRFNRIMALVSGGKDSSVALDLVVKRTKELGMFHLLHAVHIKMERAEWDGTDEIVQKQVDRVGVPLFTLRRSFRLQKVIVDAGKWASDKDNYCARFKYNMLSDHVRAIGKEATKQGVHKINILMVRGIRADETSYKQAMLPVREVSPEQAGPKIRQAIPHLIKRCHVWDWYPIFDWNERQVWSYIHAHKIPYHKAYDLGMPKLSCALCPWANRQALMLGARHNLDVLINTLKIEDTIGVPFNKDYSLRDITNKLLGGAKVQKNKARIDR